MKLLFVFVALVSFAADVSFESRKKHVRELLDHESFQSAAVEAQALNRQWPDDVETYQLMAAAQLALGDYEEADHTLQWMLDLRIGKADAKGYMLLARFREVTGDLDGAIEAMNLAFARPDPAARAPMLAYLAHLHLANQKLTLAAKFLPELKADPVAALSLQADLLLAQGKREEAIAALRELSKSADPRHLYRLAIATENSVDYLAFEQVARTSVNAKRELVLYLAGPGQKPAEALTLSRLEAEGRHDVFTRDALAFALAANGRRDEATKIMQSVLAVGTVDAGILAHAASLGLKPE